MHRARLTNEFLAYCAGVRIDVLLTADSDVDIEIANSGGELRFFIRFTDDGWLTVHSSERGDPERFRLAALSLDLVERFFWWQFADLLRATLELPRLDIPADGLTMPPGASTDADHYLPSRHSNSDPVSATIPKDRVLIDGQPIAVLPRSEGRRQALRYGAFLAEPIPDIASSVSNLTGEPLFVPVRPAAPTTRRGIARLFNRRSSTS